MVGADPRSKKVPRYPEIIKNEPARSPVHARFSFFNKSLHGSGGDTCL